MDIVIIEIDLGKNSSSLAGMDALGRVVLRRRMRRSSLESFAKGLGRCIIAMEACCGAHHLGRIFATQLDFGRFRRRERVHFPCAARYGAEFLYCLGSAGT